MLSSNPRLLDAPGNVLLPAAVSGLPKDSVANASQIITLDRDFLTDCAGRIGGALLRDIEVGLRLVPGF